MDQFRTTHKLFFRILRMAFISLVAALAVFGLVARQIGPVTAAGGLTVEIIAGYNLVVDSNVQSPSTYAPSVATVAVKYCNTGASPITDLTGYIGTYTGAGAAQGTPGIYPERIANAAFAALHPWQTDTSGNIKYKYTHLGSSLTDAVRYIGNLAPGACSVQYWSFTYPQCEDNEAPPCSKDPVWGASNSTSDDLWLTFDAWGIGSNGAATDNKTWKMTMRNEISAMANKIEPNPDGRWFNTDADTVNAGDVITTNGVNYTFGNVNKGFDNDGDLNYDYNAWMQPFGAPSYDPSCFRLIRTTGTLTVTRSGGNPPSIINFRDQLYFSRPQISEDNTNVLGRVYYTFLALGGVCTTNMTPYQEAASGADNEKFNGDYGTGIPPLVSRAPEMTLSKNGQTLVAETGQIDYSIPFQNIGSTDIGLTLSSGYGNINMPFTVQDTVPANLQYKCGSATATINYSPKTGVGYTVQYSNNGGLTWTTSETAAFPTCPGSNPTSTSANPIVLRWQLTDPLPKSPPQSGTSSGTASFSVIVPSGFTTINGSPLIKNEACASLGGSTKSLACDDHYTLVKGTNSIGDFIWRDADSDGIQDGGAAESGINGVTVKLFLDLNANGKVDSGEPQLNTVDVNVIDGKLDLNGDGTANDNGEFDAYNIIGGLIDVNGDNAITSADDGVAVIGGYNVIDGYLDINKNGNITSADDGKVSGTMTASQSVTITNGLLSITNGVFAGYNTNASGRLDINGDGLFDGNDDGTARIGGFNSGSNTVVLYNVIDGYVDVSGNGTIGAEDSATLSGTYGFAYLPNAAYVVQVTTTDSDIPTGFTSTTPRQYAVTLSGGTTNNRTSDFGFGPALVVNKYLTTSDPAFENDLVTFNIDLINKLPGDGTTSGFCRYTVWATSAGSYDSGKGWQNKPGAYSSANGPDALYAYLNPTSNVDHISAGGVNLGLPSGTVFRKVEAIYSLYIDGQFVDDSLRADFWRGATQYRQAADIPIATINAYGPGQGKQAIYAWDITSGYGTWSTSDFNGTTLQVGFDGQKTGGAFGDTTIRIDAMGFRVTTNELCGSADTTIATLPLSDVYDANRLQFVSASPAQSSVTTGGTVPYANTGTITWANLGPLYAGGTRTVQVTFRALDPGGNSATTTNTASVTNAYFGNGRRVNDASDPTDVTINATGSIAGTVWSEGSGGTNGWVGTNGFESLGTVDFGIPGATVSLFACYTSDPATGGTLVTDVNDAGRTCAQQGNWYAVPGNSTATTNQNGYYQFSGLRMGYYYVSVSGTGGTQSAEPIYNGTGLTCGTPNATCNGTWNPTGAATTVLNTNLNTTNFNPIGTGDPLTSPNEDIANVNFGFSGVPNRIYGKVYTDSNGNGEQDSGEANLQGVQVRLCTTPDCSGGATATTTTLSDGSYTFTSVPNGTYYVVVTQPGGTIQTDDPDNSGPCSSSGGCDNRTNAITIGGGQIRGSYDFGYQPFGAYTIGDLLFRDWNGNGVQDPGEEGIPNITIYLYEDENNNGVIDSGVDALIATSTTNASGYYSFPNRPNGDYIIVVDTSDPDFPAGLTQTGDPDGACPGALCDSRSTSVAIVNANDLDNDFGYQPRGFGVIGDYVWMDTDGDGMQDSNESGKASVTVRLYQDQNGDGLIDTAEDALVGSATTLGYSVIDGYIDISGNGSIGGEDDLANLFGYTVIDGGLDINGDGFIGDGTTYPADNGFFGSYRVVNGRLDMNGDGNATITDDGNLRGFYLFRNLPAGAYIVQVDPAEFTTGGDLIGYALSNTGAAYNANQVSRSVALSQGQQFYEADFGFTTSAIGDFIWQDNNGDGNQDANEPGINSVTVYLYRDTDNDGQPDGSPIATATTANDPVTGKPGYYRFNGLAPGNYVVVIDPTEFQSGGTLYNFVGTYDPDAYDVPCVGGGASGCDNQSAVRLFTGQIDLSRDFGFRPLGRVGDSLWIDTNGDGVRDPDEPGIPNITVDLCSDDACTSVVATTVTDSEGNYSFGNIPSGATRYVRVQTSDPDFPPGYSQTYEKNDATPDNTTKIVFDSNGVLTSINDVTCTSACEMEVDFGFQYSFTGSYSISGTVYFDANGNGGAYAGSPPDTPYSGIAIYLYSYTDSNNNGTWDPGEPLNQVASTTTNSSGLYTFGSVPAGKYIVLVEGTPFSNMTRTYEADAVINGWTPVQISSSNVNQRDFGFYAYMDCGDLPDSYNYRTAIDKQGPCNVSPVDLSLPTVYMGSGWDNEANGQPTVPADGDGADEDGVSPINFDGWAPGASPSTVQVSLSGVIGSNAYLAGWFDWNNDGNFVQPDGSYDLYEYQFFGLVSGGSFPKTLNVTMPSAAQCSPTCFTDPTQDTLYARFRLLKGSSPPAQISPTGILPDGETEDYRWMDAPTAVTLSSFEAAPSLGQVLLFWETASELDAIGFNLYRAESEAGERMRLNSELIPSQALGSVMGAQYEFIDANIQPGVVYYYWLEFIDLYGSTYFGPILVPTGQPLFLPLVQR